MTRILLSAIAMMLALAFPAMAQDDALQALLGQYRDAIVENSRKAVEPAIGALAASGLPQAQAALETWQAKELVLRKSDGLFFRGEKGADGFALFGLADGGEAGTAAKADIVQIKPNSGIREAIGSALIRFQLQDPDPAKRAAALVSIQKEPDAAQLEPLRATIETEDVAGLKALKLRLERFLTIRFEKDPAARVAAIEALSGDLSVDARAALSQIVTSQVQVAEGAVPDGVNVAAMLKPGSDQLSAAAAYDLLVEAGLALPRLTTGDKKAVLEANIAGGRVGGIEVSALDNEASRDAAYAALVAEGKAEPAALDKAVADTLAAHVFYEAYDEPDPAVTEAAEKALRAISLRLGLNQALDLALDAISLASIYFLAAIGLAITFGVMGVINMAHGEFIMMGAYTGYVVQQWVPDYTLSLLIALPLAFAVTFAAGVAMERLVIRWLYDRPLETLLATFGISIALQQLAKNIFGTQARPLTSPAWLDGAWVMNDVVSISYIRIAIFVLALVFLGVFQFIMRRTRLGLETRAVTQNARMAASMGINPDRVNMLTFGLGSGIAGVAGVAIGLFAKVTSELGSDYIVQSFMTVVVGGVGNIWGTLAGAAMIGFLQKGIEWFNPSNTLAAQTYMIIFIIIFIQFRPRGIIALRGRAAGD